MDLFEAKILDEIKHEIFLYCKQKLNIFPTDNIFNEFLDIIKDYDSELRRNEYEYNTENISSLTEIINEESLKFRTFIEPKHDGTQIVMKVDNKIHLIHKNGSNVDKQDISLLFRIFVKFYDNFVELLTSSPP